MTYRYVYNDQALAEGERTFVLRGNDLFVRTGVLEMTEETITYRLRRVYNDEASSTNTAPTGRDYVATVEVTR